MNAVIKNVFRGLKLKRKLVLLLNCGIATLFVFVVISNAFQFELPPFMIDFIQQPYIREKREMTGANVIARTTQMYRPFSSFNCNSSIAPCTLHPKVVPKYDRKSFDRNFSYPLNFNLARAVNLLIMRGISIPEKPINPHPYSYIHNAKQCKFISNKGNNIIFLVKSAAPNSPLRRAIRSSWANTSLPNVRVVFLLGGVEEMTIQNNIDIEMKENGDIVQENFIDSYWNNTLKSIMGYNWAMQFCPGADFLFFVDDDYLVMIDNVLGFIDKLSPSHKKILFHGFLLSRSKPILELSSKWFVSKKAYPYDVWPPYLAGGAYIVSKYVAKRLQLAFPYVKSLHIDDAYMGIVAKKLDIMPKSTPQILQSRPTMSLHVPRVFMAAHGYRNPSAMVGGYNQAKRSLEKLQLLKNRSG